MRGSDVEAAGFLAGAAKAGADSAAAAVPARRSEARILRMETPSKRTTSSAARVAVAAMGFLDMKAEIGDLGWEADWSVRFDRHDTDLSRVRHQLFRGRFTDRGGWPHGEVLQLRRALDGHAGRRR